MALFVARHQHEAESCPAKDPEMGRMLLGHLSEENAAKYGISIRGEAVIQGKHTMYMILDAEDGGRVEEFMAPFAQAGSVEVLPATHCATVVERAGC
jgi:Domain of unknown function (DUF3303)